MATFQSWRSLNSHALTICQQKLAFAFAFIWLSSILYFLYPQQTQIKSTRIRLSARVLIVTQLLAAIGIEEETARNEAANCEPLCWQFKKQLSLLFLVQRCFVPLAGIVFCRSESKVDVEVAAVSWIGVVVGVRVEFWLGPEL